jgi:hypothetical protein
VRIAYIANVGTRDIQVDGKPLSRPRSEGAELLAQYDAVRARLSAPIVFPGLLRVLETAPRIEHIQLFATDQARHTTEERFYDKDTIELGRILERLLREELGERLGTIDCRPIPHNPADHGLASTFFAGRLRVLVPPETYDAVWVAPVGGADATNLGITLEAIRTYRGKCQLIYVFPGERVQTLDLQREILRDYAREEVKAHLDRRDFVAVRGTLVRSRLGSPWLPALCAYADCRLRFDFAGAAAALDEATVATDGAEEVARIEQCRTSLARLSKENDVVQPDSISSEKAWDEWFLLQRACLAELYFNLRLRVLRGEWVDFLGRLFRLSEASLRLAFELGTRHSTEKVDGGFPDFGKALEADAELVALFKQKGVTWQEPNSGTLGIWLGAQAKRDGKLWGPVHAAMKKIAELAELRNKSILAHGFQGVSRGRIEEILKQPVMDFVDRDLRKLLTQLDTSVTETDDPLRAIVRWLEDV